MTIGEAIELKEEMRDLGLAPYDELSFQADALSIEALKEYQKLKLTTFLPIGYKLPGETTE